MKRIFWILTLLFVFVLIIFDKKESDTEYITEEEARNLIWILSETAEKTFAFPEKNTENSDPWLTYGQFEKIADIIENGEFRLALPGRKTDPVPKEEWYDFYNEVRSIYDRNGEISDRNLNVLGFGEMVSDMYGNCIGEEQVMTAEGIYSFRTERLRSFLYKSINVILKDGIIYAVISENQEPVKLNNVWLMGQKNDDIHFFYKGYEFRVSQQNAKEPLIKSEKEQVSDLEFSDGILSGMILKDEKISGKLLKVTEENLELEGYGIYPIAEEFSAYKICGLLQQCDAEDLKIGYDFADFVIQDGTIHAALISRDENMEYIRVLIRGDNYENILHDDLELESDCDLSITVNDVVGNSRSVIWPKGQMLKILTESELLDGGKIRIEPVVNTGRIKIRTLKRNHGMPEYRGSLEVERKEDGMLVINEVLLEEYLYSVVPSEMPSIYPLDALKAQAVSARTYAYQNMLHASIPELGAHLDDSSAFQVYNNTGEHLETTKSVRETKGELLCYGEELARTYYYSTSCGYGSDENVWAVGEEDQYPYLTAKAISENKDRADADFKNDAFAEFIKNVDETDYENEEPWYRWQYSTENLKTESVLSRLRARFAANPSLILSEMEEGIFLAKEPEEIGEIIDIRVVKRGNGGVIRELVIEGERETYLIKTEYNIRYVLNDGVSSVTRMDGTTWFSDQLLPSAFFDLELITENERVIGYRIYGGGFGHGVGMSQNGARKMAEKGMNYEAILGFFYEGSQLKLAY